jgi:hypothetical protein
MQQAAAHLHDFMRELGELSALLIDIQDVGVGVDMLQPVLVAQADMLEALLGTVIQALRVVRDTDL